MQETHVAGTAYYRAVDLAASLAPGQTLILRRQPDNPHDPLAIEVLTASGDKLGYVPRAANPPYARLMDAGHIVNARIAAVRPDKWDLVRMEIDLEGMG
ncbi:MAG: HIRAN domain-containing protein [Alphaproteobacteria bacterium]|nr:HIRAN domain-containing protein [Alphaproteobacteria bacterium]